MLGVLASLLGVCIASTPFRQRKWPALEICRICPLCKHCKASGLLGELASVVVDTDAFGNFIRDQGAVGCSKTGRMEETMKQVHHLR